MTNPISPATSRPDDPAGDTFFLAYYTILTFGIPICILAALFYHWARHRLWDCCCYYDVEAALDSHPPPPERTLPCLAPTPAAPPRWAREFPLPPPERIREVAASCSECAICTGAIDADGESGSASTLPLCGHRFHKVCVYVWLHRRATCPICRRLYPFPVRPKLNLLLDRKR